MRSWIYVRVSFCLLAFIVRKILDHVAVDENTKRFLTLWTGLTCPTHRRFSYIIRLRFFLQSISDFRCKQHSWAKEELCHFFTMADMAKTKHVDSPSTTKKTPSPWKNLNFFRLDVPFRGIVYYHLNTPCNKKLGFAMVAEFPWKNKLSTCGCCKTRCRTCLAEFSSFMCCTFLASNWKAKFNSWKFTLWKQ